VGVQISFLHVQIVVQDALHSFMVDSTIWAIFVLEKSPSAPISALTDSTV
jgi:hypothetical protein